MSQGKQYEFYKSREWIRCRDEYRKKVHGLCERCLSRGLYTPGDIVHHKVRVTPETVNDPSVIYDFSNLELLCRKCHGEEHKEEYRQRDEQRRTEQQNDDRFTIDEFGRVKAK